MSLSIFMRHGGLQCMPGLVSIDVIIYKVKLIILVLFRTYLQWSNLKIED
jgi:hypothetical protein